MAKNRANITVNADVLPNITSENRRKFIESLRDDANKAVRDLAVSLQMDDASAQAFVRLVGDKISKLTFTLLNSNTPINEQDVRAYFTRLQSIIQQEVNTNPLVLNLTPSLNASMRDSIHDTVANAFVDGVTSALQRLPRIDLFSGNSGGGGGGGGGNGAPSGGGSGPIEVLVVNTPDKPIPTNLVQLASQTDPMLGRLFADLQTAITNQTTSLASAIANISNNNNNNNNNNNGADPALSRLQIALGEFSGVQRSSDDMSASDVLESIRDTLRLIPQMAAAGDRRDYSDLESFANSIAQQITDLRRQAGDVRSAYASGQIDANDASNQILALASDMRTLLEQGTFATGSGNQTVTDFLDSSRQLAESFNHLRRTTDRGDQSFMTLFRDLQQMGVELPYFIRHFVGQLGGVTRAFESIMSNYGDSTSVTRARETRSRFVESLAQSGARERRAQQLIAQMHGRGGMGQFAAGMRGFVGGAARGLSGAVTAAGGMGALLGSVGPQLGITAALFVGSTLKKLAADIWNVHKENYFKSLEMREAALEASAKRIALGREQLWDREKVVLDNALELEKKRISNQNELIRMRTEMNNADLAAQERLNSLELERLERQQKLSALRKDSEFGKRYIDSSVEEAKNLLTKNTSAKYAYDAWYNTFFGAYDQAQTDMGNFVSESVMDVVQKRWGKQSEAQGLAFAMSAGKRAGESSLADWQHTLEVMSQREQMFLDEIATFEGDLSAESVEKLSALRKQSDDLIRNMPGSEMNRFAFGQALRKSFEEQLGLAIQQTADGVYEYVDQNGQVQVLQNIYGEAAKTLEEAASAWASLQNQHSELIANTKAREAANAELEKERALLYEKLKLEASVNRLYYEQAKAIEKFKKELRQELFEHIKSSVSQASSWQESNEFKMQQMNMWALEAQQKAQLKDPRLALNPTARMAIELRQTFDKQFAQLFGDQAVKKQNDLADLEIKQNKDLWEMQLRHEDELFKLRQDNEKRLSALRVELISLQKGIAVKIMDTVLAQWKTMLDPYGKNKFDMQRELREAQIALKFDRLISALQAQQKKENASWENEMRTQQTQDIQRMEKDQMQQRLNLERAQFEERWKLEEQLLKLEFEMRLKQIEYEVKYRADLERQQAEMEKAGAMAFVDALGQATDEEIAWLRNKKVEELTAQDRILTEADQIKLGQHREAATVSNVEFFKGLFGDQSFSLTSGFQGTYADYVSKQIGDLIEKQANGIALSEMEKAVLAAYREIDGKYVIDPDMLQSAVKQITDAQGNKLSAQARMSWVTDQGRRINAWSAGVMSGFAGDENVRKQLFEAPRTELQSRLSSAQRILYLLEKSPGTLTKEEQQELDATSIGKELAAENQRYEEDKEALAKRGHRVTTRNEAIAMLKEAGWLSNHDFASQSLTQGQVERTAKALGMPVEAIAQQSGEKNIHGQMIPTFRLTEEGKRILYGLDKFYAATDNQVKYNPEDFPALEWGDVATEQDYNASAATHNTNRAAIIEKQRKEVEARQADLNSNEAQEQVYLDAVSSLSEAGNATEAAIASQTMVIDAHSKIQEQLLNEQNDLLAQQVGASRQIKDLANQQAHTTAIQEQNFKHMLDQNRNGWENAINEGQATRSAQQELATHSLENQKAAAQARNALNADVQKRIDTLRADIVRNRSQAMSKQRDINDEFSLALFSSNDGNDWMKAIIKRNQETQFNYLESQMAERHRRETEAFMQRGNITEEEKARLEARQEQERGQLASAKKLEDTIRESINGVGGLRSLVTEGTGNKSDLEGAWERIQTAAFGHVMDPTADAITMQSKQQQLDHAALMQYLASQLPLMVANTGRINEVIRVVQTRGMGTVNNYNVTKPPMLAAGF